MNEIATRIASDVDGWAERINACWRQSVEAFFAAGRLLLEAKDALPHGQFRIMCDEKLPFGHRKAQMLMAIAGDPRLTANAQRVALLPPNWGALYDMTRLDDTQLDARFTDGTISPVMERKDISTAVKQQARATREFIAGQKLIAQRRHGVIVEDFEWDHVTWSEKGKDRAAENHYPVSRDAHTAAEIVERTKDRFSSAADDCVCFMWATIQHAAVAMDVLRLRGFDYRSQYAWGKDKIGLGYWSREKHEVLLIGVKGHIDCPAPGTQWDSLIDAPRGEHSAKPECFLEMIEGYFPTLPKLELNRRGEGRPGWDVWGNQAIPHAAVAPPNRENALTSIAPAPLPDRASTCLDVEHVVTKDPFADLKIPAFLRRTESVVSPVSRVESVSLPDQRGGGG